jgi:hypothetical protein
VSVNVQYKSDGAQQWLADDSDVCIYHLLCFRICVPNSAIWCNHEYMAKRKLKIGGITGCALDSS